MAAAGLDAPSIEASVSSKLFNSGHTLGSFLDVGNTSSASTQPPIDIQDDASPPMKITTSSSGTLASPPSARTPRTGQATSGSEDSDVMVHYPPASSSTSTSLFSASKHPNLLPQHQHSSLDPSPTSSNNSSAPPSFEYVRSVPSDRLAVNHPSSSYHQASLSHQSGLTESSTGLLAHDHVSGESSHSNSHDQYNSQANGFAKVSGGRKSMQVFGTPPVGIIGVHKPREIIRLDRDYSSGEICQFWSGFAIELEGRITATQHLNVMNELNAILASAFDPYKAIFDNVVAVLSLYLSTWLLSSHYDKEISRFEKALAEANKTLYNPAGLNLINPKKNGYLFLELEYY